MVCDSKLMRRVYNKFDPSIDESGVIGRTISLDGSRVNEGRTPSYGIGCFIEVMSGLVINLGILFMRKLCRYLDSPVMHIETYVMHSKKMTIANNEVVNSMLCDAKI